MKDNVIELKDFLKELNHEEFDEPAQVIPFPAKKEQEPAQPSEEASTASNKLKETNTMTASKIRQGFEELYKRTTEMQQDFVQLAKVVSNIELELFRTSAWIIVFREVLLDKGILSEAELQEVWKKKIEEPQAKALKEHQEKLATKQADK